MTSRAHIFEKNYSSFKNVASSGPTRRFIQEQNHIITGSSIHLTNTNVRLTGALISVLSPVANLFLKSVPQVIESY